MAKDRLRHFAQPIAAGSREECFMNNSIFNAVRAELSLWLPAIQRLELVGPGKDGVTVRAQWSSSASSSRMLKKYS